MMKNYRITHICSHESTIPFAGDRGVLETELDRLAAKPCPGCADPILIALPHARAYVRANGDTVVERLLVRHGVWTHVQTYAPARGYERGAAVAQARLINASVKEVA